MLVLMYRTGMYTGIETLTFRTSLIIGHTGPFQTIPAGTENFFLFYLSFVIFELLLRQTGNLFKLTYQYYLFSQYAMVSFKLSIIYIYIYILIDTKV